MITHLSTTKIKLLGIKYCNSVNLQQDYSEWPIDH